MDCVAGHLLNVKQLKKQKRKSNNKERLNVYNCSLKKGKLANVNLVYPVISRSDARKLGTWNSFFFIAGCFVFVFRMTITEIPWNGNFSSIQLFQYLEVTAGVVN